VSGGPDFDAIAVAVTPEQLAAAIGAEKDSTGYRCPRGELHRNGDEHGSLSIFTDGGRTTLKCHRCGLAGSPVTVASMVWGVSLSEAGERLACKIGIAPAGRTQKAPTQRPKIERRYAYVDQDGVLLFEVVRVKPKGFRQRRPNGDGGWIWNLKTVKERPLYGLPEVNEAVASGQTVYVVEGEKDVEAVEQAGGVATCNPGGAGKWRDEHTETLRDADVIVVADQDDPGREHAHHIAASLRGIAASVWVVAPASGADAADHLDAGFGLDEFVSEGGELSGPSLANRRLVRLSDVEPEPVRWLWPGRIPLGKLTMLDGDPGLGKSTLALDIAARLSRGDAMPDGSAGDMDGPAGTVILTAEDGLADTVRPRLDAAGADTSLIVALRFVEGEGQDRLPTVFDVDEIEEAITRVGARLIIVDPLVAYLGVETNSYRDQDVRYALAGLAELADRLNVAVVAVRHLNKMPGGNPLYRGGGSIGLIAAARSGLLVAADPEDETAARRVLASTKSNLAAPPPSLAFHLVPGDWTVRVAWDGETTYSAAELLTAEDPEERSAADEARAFLIEELASGRQPAADVKRNAIKIGIAERTLKRAKRKLAIEAERDGFGADGTWYWRLPVAAVGSKGANIQDLAPYEGASGPEPLQDAPSPKGGQRRRGLAPYRGRL
jgi:RecA-family ATPase